MFLGGYVHFRKPSEFMVNLCRIDSIMQIMHLTILNISYKAFTFTKLLADKLHNINILTLIETVDSVAIGNSTLMDN